MNRLFSCLKITVAICNFSILNNFFYFHFRHSSPVEILPGDELRTKCVYDTTSRNETTRFGWGAAAGDVFRIGNILSRRKCANRS